jgi:murein DD-endopeptidase MepM/ murein hydrolase activator NlpD
LLVLRVAYPAAMAHTRRISLVALIVSLVLALAAPAGAETAAQARQRQAQAKAKAADLAKKIDALKASDSDLDRAVKSISAEVQNQQARADAARQALEAAEQQRDLADAAMQDTANKVAAVRSDVVQRAVASYVQPQVGMSDEAKVLAGTDDLADISRRATLLNEVAGRDRDTLDQLHGLLSDLARAQDTANRAHALADERRKLEDQSLSELQQAASAKQRLQGALEARISAYQADADAVAKQETALTDLIRSKDAAERASRGDGGVVTGRISGAGLIWPVSGPITSPFGYRWGRLHAGIDIGVGIGTPIHAAKAGTIIYSSWMSGYGNVIIIDHGGGFSTLYGHQSRLVARDGQYVTQGQLIGYSGNTGESTGPHVHFETRVNGNPQNPRQYLP